MKRKLWIRICIVVLIIWLMWFSDWSFASDSENFEILGWSLNYIVTVLAWIWIFFAKLAWTFLTNKWIYGEVLWWDALLWKFWNLMKNIANFSLWFYFVYTVFKWLIKQWKEDITQKLKDIILWLLIAWVWIQASRFLTAAVIDVSTVTLAAAWAFPSQIISDSPYTEKAIKKSLSDYLDDSWNYVDKGKEISIFSRDAKASSYLETRYIEINETKTFEKFIDDLMPDSEDVSWPLYFLWFTILKTNVVTSINTASEKWAKATILNTIIQWWTTIVFAIEMLVLCILALMRIIYLWMFIVLSPIAVLLWCIDKANKKTSWGDGNWFLGKFTNQISFRSFFINVFKPTVIVLWFWIAVIFVSLMNQVIIDNVGKEFDIRWSKISSTLDSNTNSWNEGDQTYTTKMDTNLLSFIMAGAWKSILEIVLCIVTVMVVYLIISIAVKMWWSKDFVSKRIAKLQEWLWDFITKVPVIPIAWYDKNGQRISSSISVSWLSSLPGAMVTSKQNSMKNTTSAQTDSIMEMWWLKDKNHLTQAQRTWITNAGSGSVWLAKLEAKRSYIDNTSNEIKTDKWKWMILNPNASDKFWIQEFTNWLNETREQDITDLNWKNMVVDWKRQAPDDKKDQRSLEKLFRDGRWATHVKTYVTFFWLDSSIDSWWKLQDADISKMNGKSE